jgi:CRP-like cAMP-binding protein
MYNETIMENQLISFLEGVQPIPGGDKQRITHAFKRRTYREGDFLFHPDHTCRELFFICKGVLRIVNRNEDGNEVTHFFLSEQRFCTILKSFNEETKAIEGIQAACDAEVLAISKSGLNALYDALPYLKTIIGQIMHQALLDKIQLRNSYLGLDATARYLLFLKQQADIALRVQLSDVASYLGITPQSLSRIRKNIR